MIKRYTRPAMGRLFTDKHKFDTWLDVDIAGQLFRIGGVCRIRKRQHRRPTIRQWRNGRGLSREDPELADE